jgi:hypothetical protein
MVKKFLGIIAIILQQVAFAQSPSLRIMERLKGVPIITTDLHFRYQSTDTLDGYEILFYYREKRICIPNLIFIKADTQALTGNIFTWLEKMDIDYYCLDYMYCSYLFGCNFNDIDTFYYCNDNTTYLNQNFDNSNNNYLFELSKNEHFIISRVRVIADLFISNDTKYAPQYYHFIDDFAHISTITKLHYKRVLKREAITYPEVFKAKRKHLKDFSCISVYD